MIVEGGCRCGSVRYRLGQEPLTTRMCWCRDCQYWACGNASVNLIVPRGAAQAEGVLGTHDSLAASGRHMRRSFCAQCGTQLFSQAEENTDYMLVRVGTLDDPARFPPQAVIWTDSAPPWAVFDPALPSFPRQPG